MDDFYDIRFRDLEFFDRLATVGSITGAARELQLPKATASRWLTQLEERIGVSLVRRTTRSVALTEAGEDFCVRAREILAAARAAQMAARGGVPAGVVRVSIPVPMGRMLAGPVIARFRERMPRVRLEIKLQNERVDLVAEGIDVAIRGGSMRDSDLLTRQLKAIAMWLYVSARHRDTPLDEVPLIASPGDERLLRRTAVSVGSAAVIVDDRTAVCDALVWGAGVGLLPGFLGEGPRAEGALVRLTEEPHVALQVHAVYHASSRDDPRIAVLIEEIEAALSRLF